MTSLGFFLGLFEEEFRSIQPEQVSTSKHCDKHGNRGLQWDYLLKGGNGEFKRTAASSKIIVWVGLRKRTTREKEKKCGTNSTQFQSGYWYISGANNNLV